MESVTIKDVAKYAGVSVATVSRVLNKPDMVAKDKQKIVQDAIDALQYVPNASARNLVAGYTRTIGIVVSDLQNPFVSMVVDNCIRKFDSMGYVVFLVSCKNISQRKDVFVHMCQRRVEAVIMFGVMSLDSQQYRSIQDQLGSIPLIKVGPGFDDFYYRIYSEEDRGSYLAVEYLIKLGHRRIALLNYNIEYDSYYFKEIGYQKAMVDNRIIVDSDYIVHLESDSSEHAVAAITRLFDLPKPPTAMILAGDKLAWYVYEVAAQRGLRIPDDLAVIGFGNTSFSGHMIPKLTTIDQQPELLGNRVAMIVCEIIRGKSSFREWAYNVRLLKRESTQRMDENETKV